MTSVMPVGESTAQATKAKGKGKGKGKATKSLSLAMPKVRGEPMPEPINDSSKAFDKAWFKKGGPKYYGTVTVYMDRTGKKYRIKPCPGLKYNYTIDWGNTEEAQKSQWNIIMAKVEEYRAGNSN